MSGEEHSGKNQSGEQKTFDQSGDSGSREPFPTDVSLSEADIEAFKNFVEEDVEPRMERYDRAHWQDDYFSEDSDIANDDVLEKPVENNAELYKLIETSFRYLRTTRGFEDLFGEVRTPFKLLPKHDARGELVFLAAEVLAKRNIPLWASHIIACTVADKFGDELFTKHIPYDPNVYELVPEPSVWYRKMFSTFEDYVLDIMDKTMPIPEKPKKWDQLPYSCWGMKNIRRKMEDRVSVFPTLTAILPAKENVVAEDGLFAVFDGHNGSECASYSCVQFPVTFVEVPDFAKKPVDQLMTEAFANLSSRLNERFLKEDYRSGATAVCAHFRGKKQLCIGWCGDSSAAIMRAGSIELLNKPHIPDDPVEAKRVTDEGGFLIHINGELRVNGVLNITRSLGDVAAGAAISSVPSTVTLDLDGSEYLLVLGSDGLFDVFDGKDMFKHIKNFALNFPPSEYNELSRFLCRAASEEGSSDNITCICVFIRPVEDLWKLFCSH